MLESAKRFVCRSKLSALLDELENGERANELRALDAQIYQMFYPEPVRRAMCAPAVVIDNQLPADASDLDAEIAKLRPTGFEDWAIEWSLLFSERDGKFGYTDKFGRWKEKPYLEPVPRFTTSMDAVHELRWHIFRDKIRLRIDELDGGDFGPLAYRVEITTVSGVVLRHRRIGNCVPSATLKAMFGVLLQGWQHKDLGFEVGDICLV